jgi:hypothetical protein
MLLYLSGAYSVCYCDIQQSILHRVFSSSTDVSSPTTFVIDAANILGQRLVLQSLCYLDVPR